MYVISVHATGIPGPVRIGREYRGFEAGGGSAVDDQYVLFIHALGNGAVSLAMRMQSDAAREEL